MTATVLPTWLWNVTLGRFGGFRSDGSFQTRTGTIIPGVQITDVYATQDAVGRAQRADGRLTVTGDRASAARLAEALRADTDGMPRLSMLTLPEAMAVAHKDGTPHPLFRNVPSDLVDRVAAYYQS